MLSQSPHDKKKEKKKRKRYYPYLLALNMIDILLYPILRVNLSCKYLMDLVVTLTRIMQLVICFNIEIAALLLQSSAFLRNLPGPFGLIL